MTTQATINQRRNRWLKRAVTELRPIFLASSHPFPGRGLKVSVGTCLPNEDEWHGMFYPATPIFPAHIVIHQVMDDAMSILCVLVHELCHFATETECAAHGNQFRVVARAIGLNNNSKAWARWVSPTPTLHRELVAILNKLGAYPQ